MGTPYYYFAATLPTIEFDTKPVMAFEEFLSDAQRLMQRNDFQLLNQVIADNIEELIAKGAFIEGWIKFKQRLKNDLAAFRAEKAGKDPSDYVRGERSGSPAIMETISQAYNEANLLAGEKILDKLQWDFLTELSRQHYFDFEYILAYGLKLKILNQYQIYRSNRGVETFDHFKQVHLPLVGQV